MLRTAVLAVVLTGGVAHADVVHPIAGGGTIDWSRGVVSVTGIGLADRHAPSPAVGRAASRRRADADAAKKLAAAVAAVPWVPGAAPRDLAGKTAWLADHAVVFATTLNPDGSWRVTLGLPIEAIRLGLGGPRRLPDAGDGDDPPAFVIDARALDGVVPVGGVAIGAAGAAGATLWLDADPPAALTGARPIKRTATGFAGGVLAVDGDVPDLAGALIVVVVRTP